MTYRVVVTATAWAEVADAYEWLRQRSPRDAERWRAKLLSAVDSLERLPQRCGRAPEADDLQRDLRQLLHGKRGGVFRIIFEIRQNTVVVLRIVRAARRRRGDA